MLEDITDFFRNGSYYFIVLFILCGPTLADSNFVISKMVQYDIGGVAYGSRASALNMEAKSLNANHLVRSCVLTRFEDLTIDKFRDATTRAGAGGFIILLPKNLSISNEDKDSLYLMEQSMLVEEVAVPVYFAKYNEELDGIISDISFSPEKKKESAAREMFNKISANGYQVVVSGASHAAKKDPKIPIIQGELIPFKQTVKVSEDGQQTKLPVIIVTTQLKNFGVTYVEPSNYDTAAFLTLVQTFSKLYNQVSSSAKYRIIFVLHESGSMLNFQGAKKFLDTNLEEATIQNAEFAICIDSLTELSDLLMHVSKPLKEGPVNRFYEILKEKAELYGSKPVTVVHKKINLADSFHKWAHERFSMKRVNAFTLSSLQSYTDPIRTSIFTEHVATSPILESAESELDQTALNNIQTNTKILAEALASYIFFRDETETGEIFKDTLAITEKSFQPYLAAKSMSKSKNIRMTFEKFLKNVKVYDDKPDPREPEFMLYDGEEAVLNIYNVKPAVFDLFLTSLIVCYLFAVYFIIIQFPKLYDSFCKFLASSRPVTTNGVVNHKTKAN